MNVGIINYGMGNLFSVKSALDFIKCDNYIVNNPKELNKFSRLILPGVGSYNQAIKNLNEQGWYDEIIEMVKIKQIPILGICLGMHLMAEFGREDGDSVGLGLVDGVIEKFEVEDNNLKIPHIGFNRVNFKYEDILFKNFNNNYADFYFVHSYRLKNSNDNIITSECYYGENFTSSFNVDNIFGTQFHPEKSQGNGLNVLKNFINFK
ncbi:imidazole glycerol phosphate synthase subunit HisH [Aquirufa antheringensis]|uniref:imidazole glycerol phosphate synthase subunit HisH n=1 Tax=Aquirufa antheringensis TaxID=2516559 RepID=UPI0022A93982|nr:imidazole glycerol phosphate synthase subunit HisH [Aquirufa antheringensis]MCZ2484745.1 imidazole glycerol phosphate synthase subunit HisH [Aquirufa antheringensis]